MKNKFKIAYESEFVELDINKPLLLQGDLKELTKENYKKLRNEIETTGFAFPIHLWFDGADKYWVIDGHQRLQTLRLMRTEGYEIPKLKFVLVNADNLKQARERVLQAISQYGGVTADGLDEFTYLAELSLKDIDERFHIPDFDLKSFIQDPIEIKDEKEKEPKKCPNCGHLLDK